MTVTIPVVVCTIIAAGLGYTLSTLGGDDEGGGDKGASAPRAGATQAARGSLGAIAARSLPDLRCTVTAAPAGQVVENAGCVPRTAGRPAIERVTLTLFSSREQLDRLYDRSRAVAGDAATGGAAGCTPGPWYRDAARTDQGGRRFCSTAPPGARIVWTADDALVLADAGATNAGALERWWSTRRDLRPAQQG